MDKPSDQAQQQIQVKISDDVLKGVYANMVQVGHGPEEFVLDFMNIFPPSGIVSARIILSPGHMKRVVSAMQENLKKYEEQFGSIKSSDQPEHKIGFRTE
jgi:Protein of unknown function (DUF3467)